MLWPPDAKSRLTGKDPDAEKDRGREKKRVTMRWLDGITNSVDVNLSKVQETVKDGEVWHGAVTKSQTRLSD